MLLGPADEPLDEMVLQDVYSWIDQIPLSRPKKNFARDFSDGDTNNLLYFVGMVAEVVSHYFPKYVERHNYPSTTVTNTKIENWHTLNRKVLRKLEFELAEEAIRDIAQCKPFVIERVLVELRQRIDTMLMEREKQASLPESDQYHSRWRFDSIDRFSELSPLSRQPPLLNLEQPPIPMIQKKASPRSTKIKKFGAPPPQPKAKAPPAAAKKPPQQLPAKKPTKVVSTMASSVVPKWEYDSLLQDSLAKEESIQMLMTKMYKLEELLQLKDMRIEELTVEVQQAKKGKPKGKAKPKY